VTEASGSSGTLITAGFAGDYGRDVLAVPGSILSGTSRSCHNLIKDGAILVQDMEDIPHMPAGLHQEISLPKKRQSPPPLRHQPTKEDQFILEALENSPRTVTGLTEVTGLSRGRVLERLAVLTGKGMVRMNLGLYVLSQIESS